MVIDLSLFSVFRIVESFTRDEVRGALIVAGACKVHQTTVTSWIEKNKIPSTHWPVLIELSQKKSSLTLTPDYLLKYANGSN